MRASRVRTGHVPQPTATLSNRHDRDNPNAGKADVPATTAPAPLLRARRHGHRSSGRNRDRNCSDPKPAIRRPRPRSAGAAAAAAPVTEPLKTRQCLPADQLVADKLANAASKTWTLTQGRRAAWGKILQRPGICAHWSRRQTDASAKVVVARLKDAAADGSTGRLSGAGFRSRPSPRSLPTPN